MRKHARTAASLVAIALVMVAPVVEGALQQKCTEGTLSILRIEFYDTGFRDGDYWDLDAKVRADGSQPGISALLSREPFFVLTAEGMRESDWERRSIAWTVQVRAALDNVRRFDGLAGSYFLVRFRHQVLFGGRAVGTPNAKYYVDEPVLYVNTFPEGEGLSIRVSGLEGVERYSEYIDKEISGYLEQMRQCQDR